MEVSLAFAQGKFIITKIKEKECPSSYHIISIPEDEDGSTIDQLFCNFIRIAEIDTASTSFPKLYGVTDGLAKIVNATTEIMYCHQNGLLTGEKLIDFCKDSTQVVDRYYQDSDQQASSKYQHVFTTKDELSQYISEHYEIIE